MPTVLENDKKFALAVPVRNCTTFFYRLKEAYRLTNKARAKDKKTTRWYSIDNMLSDSNRRTTTRWPRSRKRHACGMKDCEELSTINVSKTQIFDYCNRAVIYLFLDIIMMIFSKDIKIRPYEEWNWAISQSCRFCRCWWEGGGKWFFDTIFPFQICLWEEEKSFNFPKNV